MTDHHAADAANDTDVQHALLAEVRAQRALLQDIATNLSRIRATLLTTFWLIVILVGLPFLLSLISLLP